MNKLGNPDFLKIRNKDVKAFNDKKKQTANELSLQTYARMIEIFDDEIFRQKLNAYMKKEDMKQLTLAQMAGILSNYGIKTPSGKRSNWRPATISRLRARILNLKNIDILKVETWGINSRGEIQP